MATSVFNSASYRSFLSQYLDKNSQIRRLRKSLAEAAGCHASYLSLVLSKRADLSAEQAFRLGVAMGLGEKELDHFVDLLQWERSTDAQLKKHIRSRMHRRANQELRVSNQMSMPPSEIESRRAPEYFRDALHVAVHLSLDLPGPKTAAAIGKSLGLRSEVVEESLKMLKNLGLAETGKHESWKSGLNSLHFNQGSLEALCHHRNWRDLAVKSYARSAQSDAIHYTSVSCLSMTEYLQFKQDLIDLIKKSRNLINRHDKQEILISFCSDLFVVQDL